MNKSNEQQINRVQAVRESLSKSAQPEFDERELFMMSVDGKPDTDTLQTHQMYTYYMRWDEDVAKKNFYDKTTDLVVENDWIYLRLNVRLQYYLRYLHWGEIDEHVRWTVDNFNGLDFVDDLAQISLCAEGSNIRIFVFGQATSEQLEFINDLFRKRGTMEDILIDCQVNHFYSAYTNELEVNTNFGPIVEAKYADIQAQM